ncbi:hypothetical protein [Clostridium sp.]
MLLEGIGFLIIFFIILYKVIKATIKDGIKEALTTNDDNKK